MKEITKITKINDNNEYASVVGLLKGRRAFETKWTKEGFEIGREITLQDYDEILLEEIRKLEKISHTALQGSDLTNKE